MNRILVILGLWAVLAYTAPFSFAQKYEDGLVDKSVAIIGNDVVMLSQIEAEVQMMRMRGQVADRKARCEILENMLVNKLFYVAAKRDSMVANEANVEQVLTNRLDDAYSQLGGEKGVEEYFHKSIYKLRQEWKEALTEQSIIQDMQRKIASDLPRVTPSDIKAYYDSTDREDLPIVPTRYRIRHIVLYPDREAANLAVKEKLVGLRERVLNGERFATLARMYSQDPGSMSRGGELGLMSKNVFWPAFSDAAMSLKPGQVSQVVETPDGFHIIQLIERQGDMFNARHILIKPSYSTEDRIKAFNKLDSIRNRIVGDTITFQDAARKYSQDIKTYINGGLMADEYTGSSYYEKDQLKPADYSYLRNMQEGDVSEPFESLDNEGRNGNTIYKILYLDRIIPSHVATMEEDYNELLDMVNSRASQKAIDKFIEEKQKTTYIVIDPFYGGCNFKYKGWKK